MASAVADLAQLPLDTLIKRVQPKEGPARPAAAPPLDPATQKIPGIDREAALKKAAGLEETYKRILIKFVKTNAAVVEDIEGALADRDFNLAGSLAHTLKGAAGNLAAEDVYRAAPGL